MKRTALAAGLFAVATTGALPSAANELYVDAVRSYMEDGNRGLADEPRIVEAVKTANAFHAYLSAADIKTMDAQWRAEFHGGERSLIRLVADSPLSAFLRERQKQADGLITEIIVMDAKGLSVAESEVSSDYWQGDEPKWQNTFLTGTHDIFVGRPEKDDSTQMLQAQASMTIFDPETGRPIGAITIGVNLDGL